MKPAPNTFTPEQLEDIRSEIKAYFLDELDMEIGDLQADLFIEFLEAKIGKFFYNQGVTATIKAIKDKSDDLVLLLKD